jgi:hypothetical protein
MASMKLVPEEGVRDVNVRQQVQHQAFKRQVCASCISCVPTCAG